MFHKNGSVIVVERITNDEILEPIEIYIDRYRFIISQQIATRKYYDFILKSSFIFVNIKYYGCVYSKAIMDKLKILQENIMSE